MEGWQITFTIKILCKRKTTSLLNRLRQTPQVLKLYENIILDQERRGFIERVHYLSHHPVKKDSQTTPIRIVYDCSCRESSSAASLNDCLEVGPPSWMIYVSFCYTFVYMIMLFLQILRKFFFFVRLHEKDKNFTCFLWPLQPENLYSQFQIFHFTSVPFGTASSLLMQVSILSFWRHLMWYICGKYHIRVWHWSSTCRVLHSSTEHCATS